MLTRIMACSELSLVSIRHNMRCFRVVSFREAVTHRAVLFAAVPISITSFRIQYHLCGSHTALLYVLNNLESTVVESLGMKVLMMCRVLYVGVTVVPEDKACSIK